MAALPPGAVHDAEDEENTPPPQRGFRNSIMTTHPDLPGKFNFEVRRCSYGIAHPVDGPDVEEEAADPAADAGCQERKEILEERMGGSIRETIKTENKISKKALLIETIFDQFDEDSSGSIDFKEFYLALRTCNIPISKKVAKKILDDMDVDQSGTVDRDEFVDFFRKVDNLEEFAARVELATERHVVRGKIMTVYIFVNMGVCFGLTLHYLESGGKNRVTFSLLMALASMFLLAMIYTVVYPICRIKLAPGLERLRQKVHDALHRDKVRKPREADLEQWAVPVEKAPMPVGGAPKEEAPSYRKKVHMLYGGASPTSRQALPAIEDEAQLELQDVQETSLALRPITNSLALASSAPSHFHNAGSATQSMVAYQVGLKKKMNHRFSESSTKPMEEQLEERRAEGGAYQQKRYFDAKLDQEFLVNRGQCYNCFNPFTAARFGKRTGAMNPLSGVIALSENGRPEHEVVAPPKYLHAATGGQPQVQAAGGGKRMSLNARAQSLPWN